ncbi:MAG: dTDP-4-dehydrorhamnose 3,5-epimerase [Limisphaerales bacterium]
MKFTETPLKGSYVIELERHGDERGWFARLFCEREFQEHGLNHRVVQASNSFNQCQGTLRGMHYQLAPKAEDKVVRCFSGALFDVIIDLRPESPTFLKHFSIELTAQNRTMLYVPKGFAHGFITLKPDTEVLYLMTEFYAGELQRGIRYNDPKFNIQWPLKPAVISDKDKGQPDFNPDIHLK